MIILDTTKIPKSNENFKEIKDKDNIIFKKSINYLYFNLKRLIFFVTSISTIFICLFIYFIQNTKLKIEEDNIKFNNISNIKINIFSQFLMNLSQTHYSISNKNIFNYSFFTKAKYDIYTLNKSLSKNENNIESTIYTTAIIINSICFEYKENKTNCQLGKYLDLTIKNKKNLNIDKNVLKEIKEAILPICLIEHSIDNNILSVSCPETLPENLKNNIIYGFQSIKPNLSKENKNIMIDDNDNGTFITLIDKNCKNKNENGQILENIEKIFIDKKGNLKSNQKKNKYEFTKDENNKYSNSYNYSFEEISSKNNNISIENNFKYNLNIVLEIIKPLMKKEKYIKINNINLNRKLEEKNIENIGIIKESFFSQSIFGVNILLNIEDDLGLGKMEKTKLISNLIRGSNKIELYHDEISTNINETLNKFIFLSKAGNKLANLLHENLNKYLSKLPNALFSYINDLNKLLVFEDLSSIFNSFSAIDSLKTLPNSIISVSNNLYINICKLNNNFENSIIDIKNKLKNDILNCLDESKNIIFNSINNITELNNILTSDNNIITLISRYYLNELDISYGDFIYQTKSIIDDFKENEKYLIENLLNRLFMEFSTKFVDSIRNTQSLLDKLVNNLESKSLSIEKGNNTDIEIVKDNLMNTKNKLYDIMPNIEIILRKEIDTFTNEYFKSNVNFNFDKIYNKSVEIEYSLENKLYIDKTFDDIMKNFKNKFMNLLNYIDKTKREIFPLKNNIIGVSYFINMEDKLQEERINILRYIKEENKQYLLSVQNLKESFISNDKKSLDNAINLIDNQLSELNLYNLNLKYNEMLTITFNTINSIIENNKNLSIEYLTNVANSGSCYCTQAFINKGSVFINSFTEIKNFIQLNLKNELSNRYIKIINFKNIYLQNIKTNPIIQKYLKYLNFFEDYIRYSEILSIRFDKYYFSEFYNQNYETKIDSFITQVINHINEIETTINNLYNSVKTLTYKSDATNDYYKYWQSSSSYCKKRIFGICISHGTNYYDHYDPYTVKGTNNYLNIQSINLIQYANDFDSQFNSFDSSISNYLSIFNNILNSFDNNMNSIKNQILNRQTNYLDNISQKINYFINDKFCNDLTILVYNYFKNELKNKLNPELNDILNKFKIIYDEINTNINSNIDKFKYSIEELGILGEEYYKIYYQNISYDYINSIIEQRKNDFNYTIKYYFNIILSKVNKTYSYILNKVPINEEVFNDIINKRKNELKTSYNRFINQIYSTKNNYLQYQRQLNIINVNQNDFFNINFNIENYNKLIKSEITIKQNQLLNSINKNKRESNIKSIISRFYLENILYEKQIKEIYEPIYSRSFIDLHNDLFDDLIKEILEIDQEELIQQIKNYLIQTNSLIKENFELEKVKYENILQNKIYKEFYTKENLESKINNLYSNGLKNLDINSKNIVYTYLNEILNKMKTYITNEVNRLNNELTSYSNKFNLITKTLNYFKTIIFDKFYKNIISINSEFYSKIISKFYTNYLEKNLELFLNEAKSEKYEESKFLNISIVLKKTKIEIIERLIKEYKYLAMTHINFLNQKNIQELDNLFSFTTIKNTIDNEIYIMYNNQLLPILKKIAIYESGDISILEYDLSNKIINEIDSFIDSKIKQVQTIICNMKGNKFNIEEDWKIPDFSLVKIKEFSDIKKSFDTFYNFYHDKELKEINQIISEEIKYNYKMIIENFIPSFGQDFFERIIKYNEIQKTKSLNNYLKYSINQTLNYYIELITLHPSITLPEFLKTQILSLNNIDSIVTKMDIQQISLLNLKFDNIFQETKGYFTDSFIYSLKTDMSIQYDLTDNIKIIINKILNDNSNFFENNYMNIINNNIKNTFINQYKNMVNVESNNLIKYINENKDIIKLKFNSLNTFKIDIILSNLENKLDEISELNYIYFQHLDYIYSFEKLKGTSLLLNNYPKTTILPYYNEIKYILDICTKDIVLENMSNKINNMKNKFIYTDFNTKADDIKNKLRNLFFNNMTNYISYNYGTIVSKYSEILNKELFSLEKLRRLGNDENDEQKITDIKLDKTFKLIKSSCVSNMKFIQTLYLFYIFDENINKYINEINEQYIDIQNNIKNRSYKNNEIQYLNKNLDDLNNYIINYYNKVNSTFHLTKDFIVNSINHLYELNLLFL